MSLSNLTAAFNQSSENAAKEQQNAGRPAHYDVQKADSEFIPSVTPVSNEIPNTFSGSANISSGSRIGKGELSQEELLAIIQKDVDFSYDVESKTLNINSGEIQPDTMEAIKAYIKVMGKNADTVAEAADIQNNLNIVVGKDVTFGTSTIQTVDGYEEVTPSFSGITCKSIDIQSQNITNGDRMFYGVDADIIKIADQPNMKSAVNMFTKCDARAIVLGNIPDDCRGKVIDTHIGSFVDYMFRDCDAVVMDSALTSIVYDPEKSRDAVGQDHMIPAQEYKPIGPKIHVNEHGAVENDNHEILGELGTPEMDSDTFVKNAFDRTREAAEVLGIDAFSGEKSGENVFEK